MKRFLLAALLLFLSPSLQAAEVLASIRPLALIAQAVLGPQGTVRQLVPAGASSHDYQLRPSDRLAVERADLLLWIGPAHERFLVKVVSGKRMLTVQSMPGINRRAQRSPDGERTLPGTLDPHLWLDPDNAVTIARALAEAVAASDPAHAQDYRRNAATFATQIAAFKARYAPRFQGLRSRSFIAYHDAYQYLEPLLGLNYRGSLMQSAESKPGAKHFLLLSQRIRQEGIFCLLGEPGFDQALAQHVFNDRPANLETVDELFTTAPLNGNGYETGLAQMVEGIYRCLGGQ